MSDLNKVHLFRMTHIGNIPHIRQFGITHSSSANRNNNFISIGDGSVISVRNSFLLPNGKLLGDYIPFYFGYKMPMLFVIQKGFNGVKATPAKEIVYCVTSVAHIVKENIEFVFTDGHAVNGFSSFYHPNEVGKIDNIIDKAAIKIEYWNDENDLDLKRRKEAEFLVLKDIPPHAIAGYGVYNEEVKQDLIAMGIPENQIVVKPKFYF